MHTNGVRLQLPSIILVLNWRKIHCTREMFEEIVKNITLSLNLSVTKITLESCVSSPLFFNDAPFITMQQTDATNSC